jgi:hypothetical protein
MFFCGQCGLHLNAGDKQCPRCGTPVEPGMPIEEDVLQDAPTTASPSLLGQMQTPAAPDLAGDPQKLILRPEQNAGNSSYGTQDAYEATRRQQAQEQGYGTATPGTSSRPEIGYPGDLPTQFSQNRINYPPAQDMRAEYPPPGGGNYAPQGAPYANPAQQGVGYPGQQARATANSRGRNAALILILLGLLLILGAMVLFILEHNNVLGSNNNNGGPSNTVTVTGAPTAEQQAQALIQQYYTDINNKNFSAASTLWQESQRPDLASFENGFKNTLHDDVAFNNAVAQGDGTVKVSVTVNATEQATDGTRTNNTYTGYYIVGPQNGTWQLLQGILNRA